MDFSDFITHSFYDGHVPYEITERDALGVKQEVIMPDGVFGVPLGCPTPAPEYDTHGLCGLCEMLVSDVAVYIKMEVVTIVRTDQSGFHLKLECWYFYKGPVRSAFGKFSKGR